MRTAERVLLQMVGAHSGVSEADLQRLLFLHCQRSASAPYEFVSAGDRVRSFTAAADLERLIRRGLVERASGGLRLSPEVAIEVADVAPPGETADRNRDEGSGGAVRAQLAEIKLYTVGYEGRSLENYLNRLLGAGVSTLCDVRRNPISRKFGFSKGTLSQACRDVGIAYDHFPELGIASEQRRNVVTEADRDALFDEYTRSTLPNAAAALDQIGARLEQGTRVAVTCYEEQPSECHRSRLAQALTARFAAARLVEHL